MSRRHGIVTLFVLSLASMSSFAQNQPDDFERPAWAVDGVPDDVWMLAEAAAASDKKNQAKEMLKEAEGHARAAVAMDESHVGRRFALTVVLGMRSEREGGKTKVGLASDLRRELELILERQPTHSGAHHLLGRLNAGVLRMGRITRWLATSLLGGGELKKATWEDAEHHLAFAETGDPSVSDHHLQLGYLYRDTKRPQLALAEVEHVLAMPVRTTQDRNVREEAEQLKKKLRR